jgi:hypothetical protein
MDYKKDDVYKVSDDYYTASLIDGESKDNHYTIESNSNILKDTISSAENDKEELIFIDGRGDCDLNQKLHETLVNKNANANNGYYGKRKDRSKKIKQFEISNSIHQYQVKALFKDLNDNSFNNRAKTSEVKRTNNSANSKTRYYVNTQSKDEAMPYIFKIVIALFFIALTFEIFLSMVEDVTFFKR